MNKIMFIQLCVLRAHFLKRNGDFQSIMESFN